MIEWQEIELAFYDLAVKEVIMSTTVTHSVNLRLNVR